MSPGEAPEASADSDPDDSNSMKTAVGRDRATERDLDMAEVEIVREDKDSGMWEPGRTIEEKTKT